MPSATYHSLLRTPGAAAFFLTAAIGRIGIAMTSLGIVWLVHHHTGSYATAGLVTGAFAIAEAAAGPQLGRLIDHFGQTRVLPPTLLAHATAAAALLLLVTNSAPPWAMTIGAALLGATIPQLGALSAARWSSLLRRADRSTELPAAFTLESLANATAYLLGPALISAIAAAGHPELGTILAAGLTTSGGLALSAQRTTAPPTSTTHPDPTTHPYPHPTRSLLTPAFTLLIALNLALGVYFGAIQVSVTAFTVDHHTPGSAAVLFTASSCSGLLAGALYGLRRHHRTTPRAQLALATALLALGSLALPAAGSPLILGLIVVLTGAAIPPIQVLFSVLAESNVHRTVLTQAFTWLSSASAAGSAAAAALAGTTIDAYGPTGGLAVATTATTLMAALGITATTVRPPPAHPDPKSEPPANQGRGPYGVHSDNGKDD